MAASHRLLALFALVVATSVSGCALATADDRARTVDDLERILPAIEAAGVSGYVAAGGCRYLRTARGAFVTTPGSACRVGPRTASRPLDDQARAEIATLEAALAAVGPALRSAVTELDEHGRVRRGTFAVDRCRTFLLDRTGGAPRIGDWKRIDPVRPSWWVAEASVRGSC